MTLLVHERGKRVRRWCRECAVFHGEHTCPLQFREDAWGVMDRGDTSGRLFVKMLREEFEKVHGPQQWRVAL